MTGDEADSPEAVFAIAQAAISAGEMRVAFACFDGADLLKIAGNSVRALATTDPDFDAICSEEGFAGDSLREIRAVSDRMAESVHRLSTDPASYDSAAHRQMTKDYDAAITAGLRSVSDLARFAAVAEERMRTRLGGGSVSSELFVGESLADVEIDGKKAWATRVQDGREIDDIGFVRKRDGWKIKLFAQRPRR